MKRGTRGRCVLPRQATDFLIRYSTTSHHFVSEWEQRRICKIYPDGFTSSLERLSKDTRCIFTMLCNPLQKLGQYGRFSRPREAPVIVARVRCCGGRFLCRCGPPPSLPENGPPVLSVWLSPCKATSTTPPTKQTTQPINCEWLSMRSSRAAFACIVLVRAVVVAGGRRRYPECQAF